MLITKEFPSYNTRRYGRPWIAKVTEWAPGKHPVLQWGVNIDAWNVEIEAEPGAIIRWGQKDHRGNNTENEWAILGRDGTLIASSATECRKHWLAGCPVPVTEQTDNVVAFPGQG